MNFVSYAFAALFVVTLALRFALAGERRRDLYLGMLVLVGLVFYAWNVPWHVLLLVGVAWWSLWAGRWISHTTPGTRERTVVVRIVVAVCLLPLLFFKYFDYAMAGGGVLMSSLSPGASSLPRFDLVLPLGISFYTFEAVSYVVDIHRGRAVPRTRLRDLLLFVGFFPHLVAGPIVRAEEFLYQVDRLREPRLRVLAEGAYLMIRGFFLKVVVADNLGVIVDTEWTRAAAPGANPTASLLVTVLFAFQIFCDFEGYTTIARGAAYLLGFRLPINFDNPYIATSFRSFWQRWHITLSRWLRDYLYLPLGGNRVGRARLYANLLVVMVLGGLWHGAANTFLVWGAIHGAALVIERALGLHADSRGRPLALRVGWFLVVQATVLVAWIFFRSPDLQVATGMVANLLGPYEPLVKPPSPWALVALVPVASHLRGLLEERFALRPASPKEKAVLGAGMLYATLTAYGPTTSFIYFQF